MYHLSNKSVAHLSTCHVKLQRVIWNALQHWDITVLEGHRTPDHQELLYEQGKTNVKVSKHNSSPSMAIDIAPYPIDFENIERFYCFGFYIIGVAASLGIKLRWGGDWDGDGDVTDQSFNDLVHFELRPDGRTVERQDT